MVDLASLYEIVSQEGRLFTLLLLCHGGRGGRKRKIGFFHGGIGGKGMFVEERLVVSETGIIPY